jgi:pimeloyl-ACP methyl ester carboxylesterase
MSTITTKDGTQIYYKDWGTGEPVVFSHGWPLSADSWEAQMVILASNGYRCIAHDRRGSHELQLGFSDRQFAETQAGAIIKNRDVKYIHSVPHPCRAA